MRNMIGVDTVKFFRTKKNFSKKLELITYFPKL